MTGVQVHGAAAYVDRHTGAILFHGDCMEEPLPDGIDNEERYLPVPSRKELGLGRNDALAFTEQHAQQLLDRAEAIFRRAGAFQSFKVLMHDVGLLPQWYAHQDARLWVALEEWVEEEGLQFSAT